MGKKFSNFGQHSGDEDVKIYNGKVKPVKQSSKARRAKASGNKASRKHDVKEYRELTVKDIVIMVIAAAVTAILYFLPTTGWIRVLSFIVPYLLAGFDSLVDGAEQLQNRQFLKKELMTVIASIAAYALSAYVSAVLIMLLLRICSYVEAYAVKRSRQCVSKIMDIQPKFANVVTAEGTLEVSPDYVNIGDVIVVEPGERIPLDGVIIDGISSVDTSPLSGQRKPTAVTVGYKVLSGCVNITSQIKIRVSRQFEDSTASHIINIVSSAPENKSLLEANTERLEKFYTPILLALTLLIAVVPPIFNGQWLAYIHRAVSFLIVACPCSLTISVPLAWFCGLCSTANNGVLVKGSNFFEALSKTDTMVFDKTGTITEGRYTVTDVYPEGLSEYELLSIAATAEMYSSHPVAHALREASSGLVVAEDEDIQSEEIPGRGIKAIINGRQVLVGNAALLEENGVGYKIPTRSGAAIHVAVDNKYCGHILVNDRIRRGAFDAIESVRAQGVEKTVLLTGDVLSVARPIASKMNFDMLKAELLPEDKVAAVDYLISNKGGNGAVAFVGDGINDDTVMQTSNVGIAMGALGLEDAMESADILIMDENIGRLPMTLKASRFTANIARENIYGMLGGELIILALASVGLMPIAMAAIVDSALFIATMLNSLRPLNIWKEHNDE